MTAYWTSLALVVLAEMGDKTQLLAMALACRYPWRTVLGGVFAGSLASHLLAAVVGAQLAHLIPMEVLQGAAAGAFILFGLWTLAASADAEVLGPSSRGPFLTVFLAFSLAELGDKTQLASLALAARFGSFLPVWLGATTAMMIANGPAILVGAAFCSRLPRKKLRLASSALFIAFGLIGLAPLLPLSWRRAVVVVPAFFLLLAVAYLAHRRGEAIHKKEETCRRRKKN